MITNVMERLIDFTRTSGGGYFGPDGLFRFTPASRNLLTYTQEFDNAAWTKSNANAYPFDPVTVSLGPELVTNGDFSAGSTGWTISATAPATANIAGGKLTLVSPAGETASAYQAIVVAGKWYKVTGSVVVRSGSAKVDMGAVAVFTSTQSFTVFLQASGTFALSCNGACDADFDNISVREVIGGLITAPDGTLTADAVLPTATTAVHNVQQAGGGFGSPLALSVYAKAGSHAFMQLSHGSASAIYANFDLLTGVVGTVGANATASISPAGDGWYRCTMTFTPGSASANRVAMISSATAAYNESWTATGTESIYLWGAQLEAASAASTYTRNVGGVYPPRFDYDPVTLAPRGLLIEEQRTNLLTYSEQFDNAAWAKTNSGTGVAPVVTANAAISPDGTMDADLVVFDRGAGNATGDQSALKQAPTVVNATAYTGTIYIKAATAGDVGKQIAIRGVAGSGYAIITLTADWTRVSRTETSFSTTGNFELISRGTITADNTVSVYLWGAQLEAGAFATSYIPTAASQVTRTADQAAVTGANFSRWYNQSEGTLVVEWSQNAGGNDAFPISTGISRIGIRRSASNVVNGYNRIGSVVNDTTSAGSFTTGTAKAAFAIKSGDSAISLNGAAVGTSSAVFTQNETNLQLGQIGGGGLLNGHIRSIKYWPTRLSNSQLQTLSA